WVLACEVFIPLALFFVLLGLRQKKPTISVNEAVSYYSASPLTSAGIVHIMQSICPDGQRDAFGFLEYRNSISHHHLAKLDHILWIIGRCDMAQLVVRSPLVAVQQHSHQHCCEPPVISRVLSQPPAPRPCTDLTLSTLLRDPETFRDFLSRNLSLSDGAAAALLDSPIDTRELYRLFLGSYPLVPKEAWDKEEGDSSRDSTNSIPAFQNVLLTPTQLFRLACATDKGEPPRPLLLRPSGAAAQGGLREDGGGAGGEALAAFSSLALELRQQVEPAKVVQQLDLERMNASGTRQRLQELLEDVGRLHKLLRDIHLLSGLARLLPKGACATRRGTGATSSSQDPDGHVAGNGTTFGTDMWGDDGAASVPEKLLLPPRFPPCDGFVRLWAGLQPILCGNKR
uniref:Uncharacterized protein n=2 Tax=Petromyzon marinus TaxID=7757 RepID=S4RKG6_PETMA